VGSPPGKKNGKQLQVGIYGVKSDGEQEKRGGGGVEKMKGRQLYVGVYRCDEKAARAYDRAAIKCLGDKAKLNVRSWRVAAVCFAMPECHVCKQDISCILPFKSSA
jgi:hypothetical protein